MAWNDNLSGVHLTLASSDHPRIGVLAGPGTGKTTLGLIRRIARLLETGVAAPHEILVLTFTRTAAQDLVSKLAGLGVDGADRVAATTIHGFCLRLLQQDAVLRATGRRTRMLLEHERDLMLRDLTGSFGTIYERRARLRAFEAGWARQRTDHPGTAIDPADVSFEAQVLRWLRQHAAMLIGEVVPIAYAYLRENPLLDERNRFRHVLVDEYQDLNLLEQSMVELLVPEGGSLMVMGDDDQSIYRFRYANPEGIQMFVADAATESLSITECLRCPLPLLDMANSVIAHAPAHTKPPLTSTNVERGVAAIVQWASLEEETEGLTALIAGDIDRGLHEPGDYLVLTNRRQVGYRIRQALLDSGVAAHSFFQDNALAGSPTAQGSLALLRLLVDRTDAVSFRVWIGIGDSTGRAAIYGRVRLEAAAAGLSPLDVVAKVASGTLSLTIPSIVRQYHELLSRLEAIGPLHVRELVDELFPESDPDLSLMRELGELAVETSATARDLLLAMLTSITQPEVPQSPDYVRVMSLHKSKGLTSPVVLIAAALDGILPTIDNRAPPDEQEAAIEEQRRLFYVAITREDRELVISYPHALSVAAAYRLRVRTARQWQQGGEWWARALPSRYIAELGAAAPVPVGGASWLAQRAA